MLLAGGCCGCCRTKNLSKFFGDAASRQAAPGVRTAAVYMGRTKNGPEMELTKKHRNVFKGHKEAITSLFYDNGIMYTASTDLTIKSWNPKARPTAHIRPPSSITAGR